MEGFNIVDGVVFALVLISAILAYSRGLVRELLSIAGWVIAAIAAFAFAPMADPLVREIPILRDIIGSSCELGILAAFAAVFAVALVLVSIFTPLLAGAVQNSAIGPVDQGFGLLFGVARGVVLVAIALVIYNQLMGGDGGIPMIDDSRSRTMFADIQQQLAGMLPEDGPQWIAGYYERLTQNCVTPESAMAVTLPRTASI
jgi:membrane protein required for colicin V production